MDWKTRIPALLLWLSLVFSSFGDGNAEQRIVCYYTNWSVYRPGTAKFSPQNINPYLCTHLIYAFGGFTKDNTLKPFDKYQDIEKGGYAKFTGLKTYNKNLKTMLAIGGWNEASSRFSPMVADPDRRKEFVKNSIKFLRQNHFDGLDLDWEYPAFRDGGKPRDKNNYADLVQELREEFDRESSKTGRPRLLLSMAVPAGIQYIDKGYDVPRLNDYLDFINLLSYDYHSAYEPAANHHSPLYPLEEDNEYNYDTELTIDYTIEYLLKSGASSGKIVLGIPTYGRSYTLFNEDATDIGAPADGPGEEGDATREKGYLAYYEICESIAKSDEWEVVQPNPSAMGPYAFRGNQWVGYDDEDIVRAKARYVNEKKLGGIMFWSIDNDDFRGKCHGRPYPLIEAAKEALLAGDEKSNSGTKTKLSDNRKKTRNQGVQRIQGNTIGRKLNTGRRTTTTQPSTTRRRITSKSNGRYNGRINGRTNEDDEDNDEEEVNAVKAVEKPKSRTHGKNTRSRNRTTGGGRRKQQNSRRNDEDKKNDSAREESRNNKLTTPEPPTTPDPGSDFKCEDEGFFSHPRDCKKYFWCLDSGPGGLGIVAHQFTCPSGLVFNKGADSCDYPRNVVCPKTKNSQGGVTTTRAPITAATSRTTYLYKTTQRTTTQKSESEEEYEYYDDDDEDIDDSEEIEEETRTTTTPKPYKTISRSRPTTTTSAPTITTESSIPTSTRSYKTTIDRVTSFEDEEDPRVIKELIDLIKKAGGIEQLEKQLHYQEKNSGGNAGTTEENGRSTPATISRSLYERVLNRQATRISGGFLGSFSTTQSSKGDRAEQSVPKNARIGFVNGPGGAQFEGLDNIPEVKNLRRTTKHQYVTIDRQRQSTSESPNEDEVEIDEENDGDNTNVASSEDRAISNAPQHKSSNRRVTPSYVNIRRSRPSTTTSENDVELKDEDEDPEDAEEEEDDEEEEPVTQRHRISKTDEESPSAKSRYTNVQRFRSTTSRNSADKVTEQVTVKNDSRTSTTTSTTTTERFVPVTEEISKNSVATSTTSEQPSTSLESLITQKPDNISRTLESTTFEASSIASPETTTTSNESSLKLVDNSATEILFTTVPASSIRSGITTESFTLGPSSVPVVSQPRPFGFNRRGRPTTTTTRTTNSGTATVTEQTARSKVDSSTLRLPTLKELVGLTTSPSSRDSTTAYIVTSTTDRVVDTTIKVSQDEHEDVGYENNRVNSEDLSEGKKYISDDALESTIVREIFDNDILGSEEIQRRSSSTSFVNVNERPIDRSNNDDENMTKREKTLRRVEVPVKILDDTNGEEIAELVLLRVPESRLNSAILKPVFRIKILEHESEKVGNSTESSLENELSDSFRSTSGKHRRINSPTFGFAELSGDNRSTNRPRNRQRIVKARRRTRIDPLPHDKSNEKIFNEPDDERTEGARKVSGRRDNTKKSMSNMTTIVPEFSDTIPTTVRVTTMRGNITIPLKLSNVTRGFYVTKNIDETSRVTDSITTNFVESTQYKDNGVLDDRTRETNFATREMDLTTQEIDLTTQEIDLTTQKIDLTTQIINFTIPVIDITMRKVDYTQIDETSTPATEIIYSTAADNLNYESTSLAGTEISMRDANEIDSIQDQQLTSENLETVTPDYTTSVTDQFTESFDPLITMTEQKSINEPEITTFRPWTIQQVGTTDSTIPIEFTTLEYSPDSTREIVDNYTVTKAEETTENTSETLNTTENSHWRSSTIRESANSTIAPAKTRSDINYEKFQTGRIEVENTTESMINVSDENNPSTTSESEKPEANGTTVSMKSTFNENNEKTISQTERSLRRTTNVNGKATTYKGVLNRGGARYKASSRSIPSLESSLETDDYRNNLTSEKLLPATITISTESYNKTVKSPAPGKSTRLITNIEDSTASLSPNSRSSSRGRNNARKTTKSFETSRTGSNTSVHKELTSISGSSTESYDKMVKSIVNDESSYLTTNFTQTTVSHSQKSRSSSRTRNNEERTTKSVVTDITGSNTSIRKELPAVSRSSTESYDRMIKSTVNDDSTYLTTNFDEGTVSLSQNSISSTKVSYNAGKTRSSFETAATGNETSHNQKLPATSPTSTESYDKTTINEETTYSTTNFTESTESHSPNSRLFYQTSFDNLESINNSIAQTEQPAIIGSTEFNDKTLEQTTVNYLTSRLNYLTTNFVESTGSESLATQNFDPQLATMRSIETNEPRSNSTMKIELPATSSTLNDIYDKTVDGESTTAQIDYPNTSIIETNDNPLYTEATSEKTSNFFTTTDTYDKITETLNSIKTIVTDELISEEENQTESYETTVNYEKTSIPWLYVQRDTDSMDDRKNNFQTVSNDATTVFKLESSQTTTTSYPSTDRVEFITHTGDVYTNMNNQQVAGSKEFVKEIVKTSIPRDDKNDDIRERKKFSRTTTLVDTTYGSTMETTNAKSTTEKIDSIVKEFIPKNQTVTNEIPSTTTSYEKNSYSTIDSSRNFVTAVIEPQTKRTRGRVRFTNFAGNPDDESGYNRRPVKQVVVRRRLANDHRRNATTSERNFTKSTIAKNENIENQSMKNEKTNNNVLKNERIKSKSTTKDNLKTAEPNNRNIKNEAKNGGKKNKLNDRLADEKIDSLKPTRRRVVVYRGRPRTETIVTTPTSTTIAQSSSLPGDETIDDRGRRRRKWRKRIVLKRPRIDAEEDDQSIAETGDFRRALIDDELVGDIPDELGASYVVVPHEIVNSSEREDIGGEVNLYKSSGSFLRRPGTLIRSEAFSRLRPKSSSTSAPIVLPTTTASIFSRIQSVDPTDEIKTGDQSVRAQELAVTLADPPAIRSSSTTGRVVVRKGAARKISTTIEPRTEAPTVTRTTPFVRRRQNRPRTENLRIIETPMRPRRPAIIDYDYYVDDEIRLVLKPELKDKLFVTRKGGIKCLDQGNFAHPTSCKKFITCARMVNGQVVGTEYTCPDKLSFDPVGGICNWSAGLGCEETSKSLI